MGLAAAAAALDCEFYHCLQNYSSPLMTAGADPRVRPYCLVVCQTGPDDAGSLWGDRLMGETGFFMYNTHNLFLDVPPTSRPKENVPPPLKIGCVIPAVIPAARDV